MFDISLIPLPVIFVFTSVHILGATEIGIRLGRRVAARGGDTIDSLESATLGLLALMIGFSFAMALSRYDARRNALLQEANAIGTAALRARLLPAPHNSENVKLLRDYVQIRLQHVQTSWSSQELADAIARSNAIQEALWQQAKAVSQTNNAMVPTGLYIQALNDMIDNQESRLTALRNRVPVIALLALYGIAILATGFVGYRRGQQANHSRIPPFMMGLMLAAVILLIQDLDRPNSGFIRVKPQPMLDTAEAIAGYRD